jgi:hypothetical protein
MDGRVSIVEVRGDLFSAPTSASLAHCVSTDLAMSKGIATLFVKHFGGRAELSAQRHAIGDVAVLERDGRYIYYLITKERYYHNPTLTDLARTLEAMREHMAVNSVTELCIPKIGSGLDKLSWKDVRATIESTFAEHSESLDEIKITVYVL